MKIDEKMLSDGYVVIHDDGTSETFKKNTFNDGYTGNKGTKVDFHNGKMSVHSGENSGRIMDF